MNILIVRVSSLGDIVHNMPMVADILRHTPDAKIDWVVEEAYVDLVRLNTGVQRIIPFALRRWRKSLLSASTRAEMAEFHRQLRATAYDLVLETQGLAKTGVIMGLARLARGGCRIGLANGTEGSGYESISRIFHSKSVTVGRRTHAVQRSRLVAAEALGYSLDQPADFKLAPPELYPAWLPSSPYAVFFHATARAAKQWNAEHWIAIAKSLEKRGMPILLPWGNDAEKQAALRLASQMAAATVLPPLSMMEAVALAQNAALVVGVDTGLTHIAAACNRPTIELYCDSPRWKTEGNWSPSIINLGDQGVPPTVAEVEQAIATLLDNQQNTANRGVARHNTPHDFPNP